MLKVLLINGSPHEFGCTNRILKEISNELEKNNIQTNIHWIGNNILPACIACNKCQEGKCIFNDQVNEILSQIDEYEALIIGSPVYYAGISGQLVSFLNRLFYASNGKMKNKLAASVVNARRGGASSCFDQINKYFLMSNMIVVGSQYWNMTYGTSADEVELDKEGLQTMRSLAKNFSWLLKCIECGKKNNISYPQLENKIRTNFIQKL